jgi:thiosulfate dehydrogenase [quinone] large subunit
MSQENGETIRQMDPRSLVDGTNHGVIRRSVSIFLRLALGVTFLTAVADRFGLWGQVGTPNVAWGDFARFTQYTGQLNPWAPAALVPALAWVATAAELALGVGLLLGLFTRWSALLSGLLLFLFASGMSMGTGMKSALNSSVFSASAAAFALAVLGPGPWSVDGLRRGSSARGRAA